MEKRSGGTTKRPRFEEAVGFSVPSQRRRTGQEATKAPALKKPPPPFAKLNPRSLWQEPERIDGLTLYERHRKPRPVIRGRSTCSLKALAQEFRCVICLGPIRKTRMVVECLHRFCEACIDRSMRVGRMDCPICRGVIPSRRSLAPDPDFDKLILSILGPEALTAASDPWEESKANGNSESLQKAIFRKQMEGKSGGAPTAPRGFDHDKATVRPTNKPAASATSNGLLAQKIVDMELLRHGDEVELDELRLPFLRLKDSAPVAVLKEFLRKKLGMPELEPEIIAFPRRRKPAVLQDWECVGEVFELLKAPSTTMIQLYYRKGRAKAMKIKSK